MAAAANALAGNPAGAAVLELALAGGRFRLEGGGAVVALAGPGAGLRLDGRAVAPATGVEARPGALIEAGPARGGVYAFLAVGGGFTTTPAMGSRAQHRRSGIGGPLPAAGLALPVGGGGSARHLPALPVHAAGPIRVLAGPQAEEFAPGALARFLAVEWRVGAWSDRMGIALEGPALAHAGGHNIVSDGVLPGAVQVPGAGRPIILMRDCPTTGGYPKLACVISADLDRLAQIPPGATVRFALVGRAAAVAAAQGLARTLAALAAAALPAPGPGLAARLAGANLVGGVVDAFDPPEG
ncbi:MAG: biotin-dependent carboxyltransferase family protein [Rhodobacteraceae bacterium]|nr:biotin-dependent carboxyltransferase family protein [Paracoccaceae bacterium]